MIKGYLINKFRGDLSLFDDGLAAYFPNSPDGRALGLSPYLAGVGRLPAEDSVALERPADQQKGSHIVVVPVLSRIANFDDLDPLKMEPGNRTGVLSVRAMSGRKMPDWWCCPVSKSTIADLNQFKASGVGC